VGLQVLLLRLLLLLLNALHGELAGGPLAQ
jgi:hypothetical protein